MFLDGFDVMLYVKDLAASVAFYRDVVGFDVKGYWSDARNAFVSTWEEEGDPCFAEMSAGATRITLHAGPDLEHHGGGAIYHVETDDVDAFAERTAARGGEASEPRDFPWGWRMTFVRDPDGHQFGFYSARAGC